MRFKSEGDDEVQPNEWETRSENEYSLRPAWLLAVCADEIATNFHQLIAHVCVPFNTTSETLLIVVAFTIYNIYIYI